MFSIGIDMIEIKRIGKAIENPRFLTRVFGAEELAEFEEKKFFVPSIAAAFAAKEAFSKAMGTGVRGFWFSDVELLHDKLGKPYLKLYGNAEKMATDRNYTFCVSITHTKENAAAVVIACSQ